MPVLVRFILNGVAIAVAAQFVPGLRLSGVVAEFAAGIILGLVNAVVRPVLILLTLPATLLTLGLFIFVLNAVCLALTAALVPGFEIEGFRGAFFGALVVSVVSWVVNALVPDARHRSSTR